MANWAGDVMRQFLIGIAFALLGCTALSRAAQKPTAKTSVKSSTLDKTAFEEYVRHLFVWAPPIEITVSDPKPSALAGFNEVTVHASQGKAAQDERFFVSKDGKQILRGTLYQSDKNPFFDQLSKLQTAGQPSFGTTGAPVVIAEFSDYQCSFCKQEAKVWRENLLRDYPSQVRFYFFDFPLDGFHPWARPAAIAGRCIFDQNPTVYWDFHDWIFEQQEQITAESLKDKVGEWANGKNVDTLQFGRCLESKTAAEEVDRTIALGRALDVTSTPTSFINGRSVTGAQQWAEIKRIIDYEIGYQKTAKNAGDDCGCAVGLPAPGQAKKPL